MNQDIDKAINDIEQSINRFVDYKYKELCATFSNTVDKVIAADRLGKKMLDACRDGIVD